MVWYNHVEVTPMTKEMEEILRQVDSLPVEQQAELLKVLEKKLAIPLKDPGQVFDDWDDPKVDQAYAETR
jgi:hypothetical protein